eukprot:3436152-Pleurochrysis_carterae.AAC.2
MQRAFTWGWPSVRQPCAIGKRHVYSSSDDGRDCHAYVSLKRRWHIKLRSGISHRCRCESRQSHHKLTDHATSAAHSLIYRLAILLVHNSSEEPVSYMLARGLVAQCLNLSSALLN